MKIRGTVVLIGLALLIACGYNAPAPEPEPEAAEPVAELTPAEQVAEMANACEAALPEIEQRQAEQSLYDRLGGQDGIKTIMIKVVEVHMENPAIKPLFDGVDIEAFLEHSTQFMSAGAGGDVEYTGRDITNVHEHMNLTPELFLEAGADVETAMKDLGIGAEEAQEVMCALVSLRGLVLPAEDDA